MLRVCLAGPSCTSALSRRSGLLQSACDQRRMVRSQLDTASTVALNSLRPIHSAELGTWTGRSNAPAIGRLRLLAVSARKAVIAAYLSSSAVGQRTAWGRRLRSRDDASAASLFTAPSARSRSNDRDRLSAGRLLDRQASRAPGTFSQTSADKWWSGPARYASVLIGDVAIRVPPNRAIFATVEKLAPDWHRVDPQTKSQPTLTG